MVELTLIIRPKVPNQSPDHLMMPKKTIIGLKRHGLNTLSLGKKMLFASQCVVLINWALDSA